jgi:hypothetical protein
MGDSTIRQVFWSVVKKMDARKGTELQFYAEKQTDLKYSMEDVEIEFVWDPFLNTTRVQDELSRYKRSNDPKQPENDSAAIILVGTGLWWARHIKMNMMKEFKTVIDSIIPYMLPDPKSPAQSYSSSGAAPNLLLLAPIQQPWYDYLSPSRAQTITDGKINAMNDYLQQLSAHQGADIPWSFSRMSYERSQAYEESGLHVVENVAARRADVLLNLRCNAENARGVHGQGYPFDRTCCSNYHRPGWIQLLVLFAGLLLLPTMIWAVSNEHRQARNLPSLKLLWPLQVFVLSTVFCFYTDRTQMFNKAAKHYLQGELLSMWGLAFFFGIISIKRSAVGSQKSAGGRPFEQPFMSREQTDEWKGWMQFMILAYHYTGASKVLWVYRLARLFVGGYLFMTGYGHASYFLKKGDYSFQRVAAVLLRMNLLSCLLPYIMRTDYMFYYFAPLVSFWFLVIYFTMKVQHQRNDSMLFLLGKIAVALILVTILTQTLKLVEIVFGLLRLTCNIHWNAQEWRFRSYLDGLIVFVGIICAMINHKVNSTSQRNHVDAVFFNWVQKYFKLIHVGLLLLGTVLTITYFIVAGQSDSKEAYNKLHPLVSIAPILTFVVYRNSAPVLRNYHSSIFAWVGRCSLETFTLQYHIWLAADTRGLLNLGIFAGRSMWTNLLAITPIFFFVSWVVSNVTADLTTWLLQGSSSEQHIDEATVMGEDLEFEVSSEPLRKIHEAGIKGSFAKPLGKASGLVREVRTTGWKATVQNTWNSGVQSRICMILLIMWFANLVR